MPFTDRDLWQPPQLIEGRKVVLRRHQPDNLAAVVRWYRDAELARLTRYQTRPMTREEVERFFQARLLSPDAVAYAIHERATDGSIGFTTFSCARRRQRLGAVPHHDRRARRLGPRLRHRRHVS